MKWQLRIFFLSAFLFASIFDIQAQFVERNKLTGTGNIGISGQGESISISDDGNIAIVGGANDNGGAGAAWVFEKNSSGNWVQESPKLVGTGAIGNARQGYSVAISGDGLTAIVGGPYDDNQKGAVWFFKRVDAATWLEMGKFVGTVSPLQHCFQGHAVAINYDGTIAIEGGPYYNRLSIPGAVWTFTRSGTVWAQSGNLMTGGAFSGEDIFGFSLSLSSDGNTAIIGQNGSDTYGKALLLTRSGSTWDFAAYLDSFSNANSGISQYFGRSVEISADANTVIIGAPQYTGNGKDIIGGAFIYKKSGGVWGYPVVIVGTQVFGNCVSISGDGNMVMLGGYFGGSFIYKYSAGIWSQEGSMLVGSGSIGNAQQGSSVALSAYSCTALMGGPGDNSSIGAAWLFTCDSPLYAVTVYGSTTRNYTNLTSACNAINSGTHGNGNITVLINQSHTMTSSAVLNGGVFNSCEIKPTANVIVDGSFAGPLILLDGADRVTIDGRIGAADDIKLTLSNTNDCIEMRNGASENVLRFIQFNSGINNGIYLSQSIPGSGGNNDITIEDCNVNGLIYSRGTAGASGYANGGTKILRNTCMGIIMYPETRDIEIRNNKMYGIRIESVGIIDIIGNQSYPGESLIRPTNLTSPGSNNTEVNITNNFFCIYRNVSCGALRCYFTTIGLIFSADNSYTPADISANINYNSLSITGYLFGLYEYSDVTGWDIRINTGNMTIKNNLIYNIGFATSYKAPPFGTGSVIKVGSGASINADYNCYRYLLGLDASWDYLTDNNSLKLRDGKDIDINQLETWYKNKDSDDNSSKISDIRRTDDIDDYRISAYPNEQHSIFKSAAFADVMTGNLHLTGASIGDIDLAGTHIPGITTDIDNQTRISPYKGADEIADFPLPVELSSFTSSVNNNSVNLNWTTVSETNNSGFDVERRNARGENQDVWNKIGFVNGNGTVSSPNNYEFTDRNLSSGKYKYRLKQIDFNGNYEYYDLNDEVVIIIPEKFELSQNFPNPYNPNTTISYSIPNTQYSIIRVYNSLGKEVATLVNEIKPAGRYEVTFDGSNLSSGIYFYKIEAGSFSAVRRMILLK